MRLDLVPCSSCGASMRWVATLQGRPMPLDPEPCADGNVMIDQDGRAVVLGKARAGEVRAGGQTPLYKSHFATCAQAGQHRRRK